MLIIMGCIAKLGFFKANGISILNNISHIEKN